MPREWGGVRVCRNNHLKGFYSVLLFWPIEPLCFRFVCCRRAAIQGGRIFHENPPYFCESCLRGMLGLHPNWYEMPACDPDLRSTTVGTFAREHCFAVRIFPIRPHPCRRRSHLFGSGPGDLDEIKNSPQQDRLICFRLVHLDKIC